MVTVRPAGTPPRKTTVVSPARIEMVTGSDVQVAGQLALATCSMAGFPAVRDAAFEAVATAAKAVALSAAEVEAPYVGFVTLMTGPTEVALLPLPLLGNHVPETESNSNEIKVEVLAVVATDGLEGTFAGQVTAHPPVAFSVNIMDNGWLPRALLITT